MIIRDAKQEDKKAVFEMAEDFYNGTDACLRGMDYDHYEKTYALCLTENPYARLLVLEEEGTLQGFCLLSFTWSNESGGFVVLIEELYSRPECRGKGYGKKIMEWLEEEYQEATRFRLEASYQNQKAIDLYQRLGYEELKYYQMIKER